MDEELAIEKSVIDPMSKPAPVILNKSISGLPENTVKHSANNSMAVIQNSLPAQEVHVTPADPATSSQESDSASQVQALLLIDADGKVQQIIWNKLPALTEQGLSKMEQRLRQKSYLITGRPYTTTETVEVVRDN